MLKVLVLGVLVALSTTFGPSQASAYGVQCGPGDFKCADAEFNNDGNYVSSKRIWFDKGETIYFEWENEEDGLMQVAFAVHNYHGEVSDEKVATGKGGNNFGTYTVDFADYYHLFAACEGGNDTRCKGGGLIKKF